MIMKIFTDGEARHLVCYPFSIENLHEMAKSLGIKRCWFHGSRGHPHYDVPKKMVGKLPKNVEIVSSRKILEIMKGNTPE